jgi:hypothetical protein
VVATDCTGAGAETEELMGADGMLAFKFTPFEMVDDSPCFFL